MTDDNYCLLYTSREGRAERRRQIIEQKDIISAHLTVGRKGVEIVCTLQVVFGKDR